MATRSLSAAAEHLWIDPAEIRYKISPVAGLGGTVGGDWDRTHRHEFATTAKCRAMSQRLAGAEWIETELFRDTYRRRLDREGRIGAARTLDELAEQYTRRFDAMADDMRRNGFRLADANGKPHALPVFLIGRDGQVFIGNQGNHRLAMVQALGLKQFAGRIVCRHPLSRR